MVSRISRPQLPRMALSVDPDRIVRAGRAAFEWRPPRGAELRLALYRMAWAPLWVASDIPAPRFRVREQPLPPGGPAGDHFAKELTRLVRRIWLERAITVLARAAWLPLLVGCAWLVLELQGGADFNPWALIWIELALLLPAAVFIVLLKPSRRQVARMLDRSFVLQERMLTAVENVGKAVPAEGEPPSVVYLQMADAANVITELRGHSVFRPHIPVREIVLAIIFALVLGALFFMRGVGGGLPALADQAVPAFVPAAQRLAAQPEPAPQPNAQVANAPTKEEVQAMAERSNQAQQDLKKLGDALSDQAVTRSAAEAIQRGDYAQAADLIRQVGQNAEQLSPSAREGLANDLEQAANQMSPGSSELAQSTRDAADGLRQGGDAANQGMQNLGDAVDKTASNVVSQEQLASQMASAESGNSGQPSASSGQPGNSSASNQLDAPQSADNPGQGAPSGTSGNPPNGDLQSGQGQDGDQGESGPGNQQQAGTDGQSASGQQGQARAGQQGQGQPEGAAQPGAGNQPGQANGSQADANRQDSPGQGGGAGAGAGSGDTRTGDQAPSAGNQTSGFQAPNDQPSDPKVTDGNGGQGQGTEATQDPRTAITLSRSPDAGGVQTGAVSGAASAGSGSGSVVSGGSSVQGEVGASGPDSNHVPSDYRGIVEAYFDDNNGS